MPWTRQLSGSLVSSEARWPSAPESGRVGTRYLGALCPGKQVLASTLQREPLCLTLIVGHSGGTRHSSASAGGAAADCGDSGQGEGVAGQASRRTRPTRDTYAIHLHRPFRRPCQKPEAVAAVELATLITAGPQNGLYRPASDYGTGTPILRSTGFYDGINGHRDAEGSARSRTMSAISTVYTSGEML